MELRAKQLFGDNINLSERSPLGLFLRLTAWFMGILWQLAERVYYSAYPDTAEGVSLDRLGPYASIRRREAIKAVGHIKVEGEPYFTLPKDFTVGTERGILFETTEDAELNSEGEATIPIRAVEAGTVGNIGIGLVTEIINPIAKIESVNNTERTTGGRGRETDAEFRNRFEISTEGRGKATTLALRTALLKLEGVRAATVVENNTMNTIEGRPPKSIECYVLGGEPGQIAGAILDTKAAGIETYGQETEIVNDISGQGHAIKFTFANEVNIYLKINLTKDNKYPTDGDRRLVTALIQHIGGEDTDGTFFVGLNMGEDVIYSRLIALIYRIDGVTDVDIEISTNGTSFAKNNVVINVNEVAQLAYSNVVINYV